MRHDVCQPIQLFIFAHELYLVPNPKSITVGCDINYYDMISTFAHISITIPGEIGEKYVQIK